MLVTRGKEVAPLEVEVDEVEVDEVGVEESVEGGVVVEGEGGARVRRTFEPTVMLARVGADEAAGPVAETVVLASMAKT